MVDLRCLIVGDAERAEFREARRAIEELVSVVSAETVEDAATILSQSEADVDVIVVTQAFPGQFPADEIEQLRRLAPLARIVGLLGSWCEGEMRSGYPWPGAIRLYWHQWLARIQKELPRLRDGRGSTWALPATAADEERFLVLGDEPWPKRQGLIGIHSAEFGMHDWLASACRRAGYSTLWLRSTARESASEFQAILFDGTDGEGEEMRQIRDLLSSFPGVPVLVLLNFPRIDDCRRLREAGVKAVLSKPVLLEDLFWEIERHEPRKK